MLTNWGNNKTLCIQILTGHEPSFLARIFAFEVWHKVVSFRCSKLECPSLYCSNSLDSAETKLQQIPEIKYAKPSLKHGFEYLLLLFFVGIWKILPYRWGRRLTWCVADLIYSLPIKRNKETLKRIEEHLHKFSKKHSSKEIMKKSFRFFAENGFALSRAGESNEKALNGECEYVGFEFLEKAKQENRGLVIASCHLGLWEKNSWALNTKGFPSAIVVATQHNPLCDRFFNSKRSLGLNKVIHNRLGMRHTLSLLKAGGRVVIISDVDVGPRGVVIPFLGKDASTLTSPAELACRTNSLLLTGATWQNSEGKTVLWANKPMAPEDFSGERKEKVLKMMTQVNREFSSFICDHPEQWFWLQRRWKTPTS